MFITPQVFDLLEYLIRNRERVVSDDLIKAIWNGRSVSDAALTTRLNAARDAIGDSGEELCRTGSSAGRQSAKRWCRSGRACPTPAAIPLYPVTTLDAPCAR